MAERDRYYYTDMVKCYLAAFKLTSLRTGLIISGKVIQDSYAFIENQTTPAPYPKSKVYWKI